MSDRPETGSMRFGDDWRGVFVRGDSAYAIAGWLRSAIDKLTADHCGADDAVTGDALRPMLRLLNSSRETGDDVTPLVNPHLRTFAECVRQDDGEAHAAHLDEIVAQRNLAVAQAVAAEREACARIAMDRAAELDAASPEDYEPGEDEGDDARYARFAEAMEIVQRISARGKVPSEVESADPLPTGSVVLDAKTAAHMAGACERVAEHLDSNHLKPAMLGDMMALAALADMLRGKVPA